MLNHESETQGASDDAPARKRPGDVAKRYKVKPRTGGEWLRKMLAAGVVRKLGGVFIGRWSKIDAWVESGGETRRGRRD